MNMIAKVLREINSQIQVYLPAVSSGINPSPVAKTHLQNIVNTSDIDNI
jgi:hypothetical protein